MKEARNGEVIIGFLAICFRKLPMSGHTQSLALGEAGYNLLLQRFERQPVRYVHEIPHERMPLKEILVTSVPDPANSEEVLSKADREAARKLREIWTLYVRDGISTGDAGRKQDFEAWRKSCHQNFFSPLMCIEVVCRGMIIDDVDARYKMQAGTALMNMRKCLQLVLFD